MRGRSRLTRAPGFISPSEVRRSVSADRSAAKLSPASLDNGEAAAVDGDAGGDGQRSRQWAGVNAQARAPATFSSETIRPTCSMIPVNIARTFSLQFSVPSMYRIFRQCGQIPERRLPGTGIYSVPWLKV